MEDYLEGEELAEVKHEYLGGTVHAMAGATIRRTDMGEKRDGYLAIPSLKVLMLVEPDAPSVTLYCRKPEGGFSSELYEGLDSVVPLPEIEVELRLGELYERVGFVAAG